MTLAFAAIIILLLIFAGMGLPYCFLCGSLFFALCTGKGINAFASSGYYALESYALVALPLFIMAGTLIERSNIATKLMDLGERCLRRFKGGMGATIPLVSCFFGALSGSGLATATTISTMLAPRLEERGWDRRYMAAFIAASSPLGFMIPPNMNAIIYAKVSSASVGALFLATIIPAIIWCGLYFLINRIVYRKWYHPELATPEAKEHEAIEAAKSTATILKSAIPAFLMPVIMLGGIYGGVFTATEAGAVGCLYAMIVGLFIYKAFKLKDVKKVFIDTGYTLGSLLMIFPMTMIFTRIMVTNNVPAMITAFLTGISSNRYIILLLIILVLIIAGFFLDSNILLLVFVPLLLPTASAIGVSQIQLAVITFVAIGIGACTPPMSMCLFIACRLTDVRIADVIRPLWPFLVFGALPVLLLVTFVPGVSEWLPSVLLG